MLRFCGWPILWILLILGSVGSSVGLAGAAPLGEEGKIWDDRFGLPSIAYGSVRALAVDGTDLYIGGYFTSAGLLPANNVAHWDGRRWRALDVGINGTVNALATYQGRLYAGGDFTQAGSVAVNGIAVWDGVRWDRLDGGVGVMQNGYKGVVRALAATDNALYIGGDFTHINGVAALDIARWDGSKLADLGDGVGDIGYNGGFSTAGSIFALAAAPDGTLYVGGDFTHAGNRQPLRVNGLARWDAAQRKWLGVGGGITKLYGKGEARALAVNANGDLYVGGQFAQAGNVTLSSIARWDGWGWDDLGGGLGFDSAYSYVSSLALVDDALYAGGGMVSMGGQQVNGLAVWQGDKWASVGGGLVDSYEGVLSLAASGDGGLYAAGVFTGAGELFSPNLIKWSGAGWETLGQGVGYGSVGGWIEALAVDGDGLVYAGGLFDRIAGQPTGNIAVWNGARWESLGDGVNGSVYTLATHGSRLYVGGSFTQADGMAASSLAQYNSDTGRWSALGGGVNGVVYALAVADDGTLFVAGDFRAAGGDAGIQYVARWDGQRWSGLGIHPDAAVRALAWDGRILYMGGLFSRVDEDSQGIVVNGLLAWDSQTDARYTIGQGGRVGVTRQGNSGEFAGEVYTLAVTESALYVGGVFDKAGDVPASSVALFDFRRGWQSLGDGVRSIYTPSVYALAVVGNSVYIGGDFSAAGTARTAAIARWDGVLHRWQTLRDGLSAEASVNALAVFDESLYVGGHFISAGDIPAAGFSRWGPPAADSADRPVGKYGVPLSLLGRGSLPFTPDLTSVFTLPITLIPVSVNSRVEVLAVDGGGHMYAGGSFDRIGGQPTQNVALWDGVGWSRLGDGVNGSVYALATHGSRLYVGGAFTRAGGMSARSIAQYDSATGRWSTLGSGINGTVYALAVAEDGTLFAAGDFVAAGDMNARYIARWDGVRWSELGRGIDLNGVVRALAWDGRILYMGGLFSNVQDGSQSVALNGLLAWDSQTDARYPLGNGAEAGVTRHDGSRGSAGEIYALSMTDELLYVGGVFDKAGNVPSNGVAAYDFRRGWQALGSGVRSTHTPSVYALAAVGDSLYVGGDFSAVGTTKTTGVARWDNALEHWQALSDGLGANARVKALAFFGGSVYAGGHFISAEGTISTGFARWGLPVGYSADLPGREYETLPAGGMPTRINAPAEVASTVTPVAIAGSVYPIPTVAPTATPVVIPTRLNLTPTVTPTATPIVTPIVTGTRTPTATPCSSATATFADAVNGFVPCGR